MLERRWRHPDVAAAREHLPKHRVARPAHEREVVFLGEHDVDPHASQSGHVERLKDGVVGEEVGRHDPHRRLRRSEGPHQHEFDAADVGVVGPKADAAGEHRARPRERRNPGGAREGFLGGEGPILDEHLEQLRDHRPLQPEVRVADRVPGFVGQPAAVADVEAAGESDLAVHHHDLAVVTEVGIREVEGHARGQEAGRLHPPGDKRPRDRREGVAGADAVDQHADLDAPGNRSPEGLGEDPAGGIVVEDVGSQRNAPRGLVDRREHEGIGLIAPVERLNAVAVHQGAGGRVADEGRKGPKRRSFRADGRLQPLRRRHRRLQHVGDPRLAGPELGCPRADAVDAEHGVGDRPEHGR